MPRLTGLVGLAGAVALLAAAGCSREEAPARTAPPDAKRVDAATAATVSISFGDDLRLSVRDNGSGGFSTGVGPSASDPAHSGVGADTSADATVILSLMTSLNPSHTFS